MIGLMCGVIPLLVALVGCATAHSSMMKSANKLGSSAYAFVSDADHPFPHAAKFVDQANYFLDTVDRAGDREVISAYESLWDAYQALHYEVDSSGSPRDQAGFKPVIQAFTHVAFDIRGYAAADNSVYARGGFQHDSYYDP